MPRVLRSNAAKQIAEQQKKKKLFQPELISEAEEKLTKALVGLYMQGIDENRLKAAEILMGGLRFVNKNGQPLHMMKKLELNPALLEQPLYR